MSSSRENSQELVRRTLGAEIKQLECLTRNEMDMREFILQSITNKIIYDNSRSVYNLNLSQLEISSLVDIAINIINERHEPRFSEIQKRCRVWAVRILNLLADKLRCTEEELVYDSLIRTFKSQNYRPYNENLSGLAAYCLSRIHLNHLVSPGQACQIITEVMPLAVKAFDQDSRSTRPYEQYREFEEEDFHCLTIFTRLDFNSDSLQHSYPMWVRLLVALASENLGNNQRYFKRIIEDTVNRDGPVNSRVFVAINVLLADQILHKENIEELYKLMIGLLDRSNGNIGAHIAFLLLKCRKLGHVDLTDCQSAFCLAQTILDNMVENGNLFYVDIVLEYFKHYEDLHYGSPIEGIFEDKQWKLMKKLIKLEVKPTAYIKLVPYLEQVPTDRAQEFDDLTHKPLTIITNRLNDLVNLTNRTDLEEEDIKDHVDCLNIFMNKRSHRPRPEIELKIIAIFKILFKEDSESFIKPKYARIINAINFYQVHREVWDLVIIMLRSSLLEGDTRVHNYRESVDIVVPRLLITDPDYFFGAVATVETLQLFYNYCKTALRSGCAVSTLILEIIVSWPQDPTKTKLDPAGYSKMLKSFIELIFADLERRSWSESITSGMDSYTRKQETEKEVDLLYALGAAFAKHRDHLFNILHSFERDTSLIDSKSWLMDHIMIWYNILRKNKILDIRHHRRQSQPNSPEFRRIKNYFGFARVSSAYLGLKAINMELSKHNCYLDEIRSSFETTLRVVINSLQMALELTSEPILRRKLLQLIDQVGEDHSLISSQNGFVC